MAPGGPTPLFEVCGLKPAATLRYWSFTVSAMLQPSSCPLGTEIIGPPACWQDLKVHLQEPKKGVWAQLPKSSL
jgi:hypothetical protein